jgi:hypothetical protein
MSIREAAASKRPFSGFGQSLSSPSAQNKSGGPFSSGSESGSVTTGDLTNTKRKSPDSEGMDTELPLINTGYGDNKEQYQFLSSHIPKNKSFEVSQTGLYDRSAFKVY